MATFTVRASGASINFDDLDLNWYLRNVTDSDLQQGVNYVYNGVIYPDTAYITAAQGTETGEITIGGFGLTSNGTALTGGTVTGLLETNDGTLIYTIEGVNIAATALQAALQTLNSADEQALLETAFAGSDEIVTGDGNDRVYGFAGDDYAVTGGGNDTITGGTGNDIIDAGSGDDLLSGNEGNDILRGGLGNDQLSGGAGSDLLSEFSGDSGPFGDDIYDGGTGNDRVSYFVSDFRGVTVNLAQTGPQVTGQGSDTLISIEQITATYGNDTLIGNDSDNWFWTFAGTDNLSGGAGADHFTVGYGAKILNGGSGVDTVEINDQAYVPVYTAKGVAISLLEQGVSQSTGVGDWTLTSIENLSGFYGADRLTGDENANILAGEGGDDRLVGNGGDDTLAGDGTFGFTESNPELMTFFDNRAELLGSDYLDGGTGDDALIGGRGNDLLIGGVGADRTDGGEDSDTYLIAAASDHTVAEINDSGVINGIDEVRFAGTVASTLKLFAGDTGVEAIVIGTGADTTANSSGVVALNVDARLLGNAVTIIGNQGANRFNATAFADTLKGMGGNDKLDGGKGADQMFGGAGNDTYSVENARDRVYETATTASTDTIDLGGTDTVSSSIGFTLGKFIENLTLTGSANLTGTGNELANTLIGNDGANTLKGLTGNDTLKGGAGNDKLSGGAGKDALTGGSGKDSFIFDTAPTSRDTIIDFSRAEGDKVQLSKAVFKAFGYTGTLHAEDFYSAAGATKAQDAADRVIYNTTTGVLYYDADGLGGAAAVQVALLGASTHPGLVYSDLQIIA